MPTKPGDYHYREGQKKLYWIWWVIIPVIYILSMLPVVIKRIHWRALVVTSGLFILSMVVLENIALYYGWWIWNENKLLGPKVLLVPLEEFLTYFVGGPFLVVCQILIRKFWEKMLKKGSA